MTTESKFSALMTSDLHFVVSRLPKDVCELAQKHGLLIGGGFIRELIAGNKANDIDVFGSSVNLCHLAADELVKSREARKFTTDNAITVLAPPRIPVQFITKWLFESAEHLVESFDFTVCQAAIWFADGQWHSAISARFYADLAARRLVYTSPKCNEAAGGSLMRVRKFLARGYNIQSSSLGAVCSRLMWSVRDTKLATESEEGLAKVLTGLLSEVDPLLVVDGIEMTDDHA